MLFVALDDPAGVPERVRQRPADVALALAFAAFLVVGGLLAVQRPGHPIAWLLIAEGFVWELGLFCAGYVSHALPAADVADWILDWIWVPGVAGIPLLLLLFPDGRPPSRRWRAGRAGSTLAAAVALLVAAAGRRACCSPPRRSARSRRCVVRYRRAGALERRQLAWFGYAAALIARAPGDRGRARRARRVRDRDQLPQRAAARGAPAGDRRRAPAPPPLRPRDRWSTAPCSVVLRRGRLPRDGRRRSAAGPRLAAAVVTGAIARRSLRPRASPARPPRAGAAGDPDPRRLQGRPRRRAGHQLAVEEGPHAAQDPDRPPRAGR